VAQINRHLLNSYRYQHEYLRLENGITLVHKFGNGTRRVDVDDLLSAYMEEKSDCWYLRIECRPDSMKADWGVYSTFSFDILDKADCEASLELFRKLIQTKGGSGEKGPNASSQNTYKLFINTYRLEGSPPYGNSVSPAPTHQKSFMYNALRASDCRSPRPAAVNVFLYIFPEQRMDVGSIPAAISNAVLS